jgi:hypothetical protein
LKHGIVFKDLTLVLGGGIGRERGIVSAGAEYGETDGE